MYDHAMFQIKKGARQGDTIRTKLFTLTLEEIFKRIEWINNGININYRNINHLCFSDDITKYVNRSTYAK